jgi:signal transduction histidine kinase
MRQTPGCRTSTVLDMARAWDRPSTVYLALGAALAAVYFALPSGGAAQSTIYAVLGGGAVLGTLWAVRRHRPERALPWILLAFGNGLFVVGDVIGIVQSNPPTVSAADVAYLAGYPLLVAGLLILMFAAGGRTRLPALADAAIVAFAFAIAQWLCVMGPAIRGGGSDLKVTIVSGLYPAMDVVLLAGFVGFFVSPAWRTTSFRYLLAAVAALLVGDEITGLAGYTYKAGDAVDVTWMLSYVLFAAAALHPSMRELSAPRRLPTLRVSVWRIGLLAGALLTAPVALFVQHLRHKPLDVIEITALAGAVSVLVVARMTGILRALERIRVRERSARALAEEAHSQLLFHNEQLLEADKLKDEFVALISHDLRTPLTSIVGYIELALDEAVEPALDEERRGYLDVVARSSERLLGLVDDLLFVARLQSGSLEIDPHELDLGRITAQAVEDMRPRAEGKGVDIAFLGETDVRVEADKGRIFQLLDNLISNAIKFTPEGGRIELRTARTDGGCVLEVADTGIGLSPGDAERVFDRFFRSKRATNRQIQGTGLGLFIARAITDAHGGKIGVTSTVGEGTTFRIELPTKASTRDKAEAELVA